MESFRVEQEQIRSMMQRIRDATPPGPKAMWNEPPQVMPKAVYLGGRTVMAVNITLSPTGCSWAREGGCTMCGEYAGSSLGKLVPGAVHVSQFAAALCSAAPEWGARWLRIYQEGSFLNEDEVEPAASRIILGIAGLVKGIERITIESRPEYVTTTAVTSARNAVGRAELEIGMGLEAACATTRNVCVNKGLELDVIVNAVDILKQMGLRSLAYILIKPPFLTEAEAIREAETTARLAFDTGFDAVSLEPVSICPWSLADMLFFYGLYSPPWLWTVIEVAKRVHSLGEVRIGGVEYYPPPETAAHNRCTADCSAAGWRAIRQYNATHDDLWLHVPGCSCQTQWMLEVQRNALPLERRIARFLGQVSVGEYLASRLPDASAPAPVAVGALSEQG